MKRSRMRLSRPVYESLPWLYMAGGLIALTCSYFLTMRLPSLALGLAGLAALIGGIVVHLRRRDFRELRANYSDPGALTGEEDK